MKKLIILLPLIFLVSIVKANDATIEQAKLKMKNMNFMVGRWHAISQSLRDDFSLDVQPFFIKVQYDFDGLALKTQWHKDDESKSYAGSVFNTFNPTDNTLSTNFFNPNTALWDLNSFEYEFEDGFIQANGTTQDMFGPYDYRITFESVSKNVHTFKSERFYHGLGFWITVDTYEATRLDD